MSTRILIVDDDAQIRASLRKALRAEGYEVILAADGQEGIEQFLANPIHLLLLDLNLPVKRGWDTFERLTSINPLVPIVIITGRRDQRDLAAAAGVGALFEKPFDVPMLLASIKELLAESPETHLKRLAGLQSYLRHVRMKPA
jgi:DNA-binding response OmpR family regulator